MPPARVHLERRGDRLVAVPETADASAIVAAFASWHEKHTTAVERISDVTELVAHAELEAYSVLTRLPG
ncbi:MAG TPA: hypothetical protein VK387_05955 [Thermoleophilaceae bacterium]|nr:hypothetical protein [Thermoleophilaceae bacterium]